MIADYNTQDLIRNLQYQNINPHSLAIDILEKALSRENFCKSLVNCHTEGVDSIVLYDFTDNKQGMIRFYYAHNGEHRMNDLYDENGHFVVGLHNHHYDIAKIALNSCFYNIRTEVSKDLIEGTEEMFEYQFNSGIKEDIKTINCIKRKMSPLRTEKFEPGDVAIMDAQDLHTMVIKDDKEQPGTAWMVIEGNEQNITPLIYSPKSNLEISSHNLYKPMLTSQARDITQKILELIKA